VVQKAETETQRERERRRDDLRHGLCKTTPMKHVLIIAVIGLLVTTSCNQVAGIFENGGDSTNYVDYAAWERDESINESNAYSDLFLDSAAIENFIQTQSLSDSDAQQMRNFYLVRNYQYAWISSQGLTEQGRGLWGIQSSDTADSEKGQRLQIDSLMMSDSTRVISDSGYQKTELGLTKEFIEYSRTREGLITASSLHFLVPAKRMEAIQLADTILNNSADSALFARNPMVSKMREQLSIYHQAASNGGWQPINTAAGIRQGSSSPVISAIKARLAATNDYQANDTTAVYNDSFTAAIKSYQQRNGLAPTGQINDSLINILNVPAHIRLEQVLVNMNRMMWMEPFADSNRIVVNIPSYMLYAYSDSGRVLEVPVIVGKEGANTVMFSGDINQVVFSPAWNVPKSIVESEIMPAMKRDKDYLKKKNMEITNSNDSIPTIKQLPGKDNAMGKVKFLFPNSYDIYLHDTPDKTLFNKKDRALSHGCIRVKDPEALAAFVLRDQAEWTPEKIRAAMNATNEQFVKVNNARPVYITYYTAWVDDNGQMNFRNDIYSHDQATASRMFTR
jgi:L,D-transpeptidase YcbB